MKKILIPTDFSELGDFAYGIAKKVAAHTNASIYALSVVSVPGEAVFDENGELKDCQEFDVDGIRSEAKETAGKMSEWLVGKPEIVSSSVRIGHLADDILKCIEQEEFDLVVMGTNGAVGLKQHTIGSIAEKIVRQSAAPVLTLKCNRDDMEIKDIVLISDFREKGEVNIGIVRQLQKAFDARLHLLKINTKADFETNLDVKANMYAFVEKHGLENVDFHVYCDTSVENGIRNFSAEHEMDFVSMGTHGRTGLGRMLKGSIAESVVNHIYQPILTFKI